jgi:gamma-glutamyltranspeptidase/glutathione hydrolase
MKHTHSHMRTSSVVAPHHCAVRTGERILDLGGNAFDAAVAVSITLSVVYPHMTGVGGDAFFLLYKQSTGQVRGYNGSGRAASAATIDDYRARGWADIPKRGVLSAITVPGMVDSWWSVWETYGRLPWEVLFEEAIRYAEEGFPISKNLALWLERDKALLQNQALLQRLFWDGAEPKKIGAPLIQPELSRTLRQLQQGGRDAYYKGAVMREIVAAVARDGGLLRDTDFERHRGNWVEPVSTTYRGYQVLQMPPNSQGFTVLAMLNMLENIELGRIDRHSAEFYQLMADVVRLAFIDRDQYLSDPEFVTVPIEQLLDRTYAAAQWSKLREHRDDQAGYVSPPMGQDTAYAAVVDKDGNAVSFIQSLYFDFGSAYVAGETGVILQNRGSYFSLDPQHPNALMPGKRTFHTLCPAIVMHHDRPYLLLGTQGGEGQPQTQLSLLTGILDYGLTPMEALDLPRWIYGRTWGDKVDGLRIENRSSEAVFEQLRQLGHEVSGLSAWDDQAGQAMMIRIQADGTVEGAIDRRSDGRSDGGK